MLGVPLYLQKARKRRKHKARLHTAELVQVVVTGAAYTGENILRSSRHGRLYWRTMEGIDWSCMAADVQNGAALSRYESYNVVAR